MAEDNKDIDTMAVVPSNGDTGGGGGTGGSDVEGKPKKLKYPRSIPFIISNEFCERFNFYGMKAILSFYLTRILMYDQDTATVIFHTFTMLVYFMCVFGAIIADSWLGKFKTILTLSIVYVAGSVIISLGAIRPLNLPGVEMTIAGLLLIAVGSGGIKPCVAAFGGDQFKLPEQAKAMATFFSLFYFSINSGSLISTTVTPILRQDVHCFNETSCYSLAFGVPAVLMATSIVIFVIGRPMYISKPPSGNMFLLVSKAIGNAVKNRCKTRKTNPKSHWIEYAEEKYGAQLCSDIKVLLRVLVLYIPLPIFWALFDQQGSRWTFQAARMNGDMGPFEIKPDQLQMLNPLLILIFIPMYDFAIYPLLAKIGFSRPLQKLTVGGILAGIAFLISAGVELNLETTYPVLPSAGESQLRIFNGISGCSYDITTTPPIPGHTTIQLEEMGMFVEQRIDVSKVTFYSFVMNSTTTNEDCPEYSDKFTLESEKASSYLMATENGVVSMVEYTEEPEKPRDGSSIRVLANLITPKTIYWKDVNTEETIRYEAESSNNSISSVLSTTYNIYVDDKKIDTLTVRTGGVYSLIITENEKRDFSSKLITVTEPNSMNILWLVPQYVVLTLGEVMFSVTGLEFSYSQAPTSMKSVLQACWQLTVAFGNLIVVIVAEAKGFKSQAHEFFLFAGLMFVDMGLFMVLAKRYVPNTPHKEEEKSLVEPEVEPETKGGGVLNPTFEKD